MTSRYTPARAIPPGFPDVLRDFSREVLRHYPRGKSAAGAGEAWILEFAARYFANGGKPPAGLKVSNKSSKGVAHAGSSKHVAQASVDDVEGRVVSLFRGADRDGSGKLDARELKNVLRTLGEEIGLENADVRLLISLADSDHDGQVSYAEFLPLALQIITLVAAKNKEAHERRAAKAAAHEGARYALVHGFSREELQNRLMDAFRLVDADNDGFVTAQEFAAALGGSGLGLSRKEVNLLTAEALDFDVDGNGRLSFSELAPLVFNLLADQIAKQLEIQLTPAEVDSIRHLLARECEAYDPSRTGRIPLTAVTAILRDSDLHLSYMQQQALAAVASVDPSDGLVDAKAFCERASSLLHALQSVAQDTAFAHKLLELRSAPVVLVVSNGAPMTIDRPTFDNALLGVLSSLDKGNGKAPVAELRAALSGAVEGAPFTLNDRQIDALVAAGLSTSDEEAAQAVDAASASSSCPLPLQTILQVAFDVLHHLQELDLLHEYVAGGGSAAAGGAGAAAGGAGGEAR